MNPALFRSLARRFFFLLLVSSAAVLLFSEGFYRLIHNESERAPKTIEITIPAGSAERIAEGQPGPELPGMVFVIGDTLLVHNLDRVAHQLGPIWVPPGSSGSLVLGEANDFVYRCSFQSTQYLGLTVRAATHWTARLSALWYGVPPITMFLLVYSFVLVPLGGKRENAGEGSALRESAAPPN
jgi:hypothetical protein